MKERASYRSPADFRRALTDKLATLAKTSRWTLQQLQRQMAYDRLLERLYAVDDGWVVKGATALLAREIGVRATVDIDVYHAAQRLVAEADLRRAADTSLGDWFRFELGTPRHFSNDTDVTRYPVGAYVGPTLWSSFHVDLVGAHVRMTEEPEDAPPLARVVMPDVEQHRYRVYPLVDHVADKVSAIAEVHGTSGMPSTRYKDLVDLVAIAIGSAVDAERQTRALVSQFGRRGLELPRRFSVPDRALWNTGYGTEARRSLLPLAHELDEALAIFCPFIDPVLDGSARGTWLPREARWVAP